MAVVVWKFNNPYAHYKDMEKLQFVVGGVTLEIKQIVGPSNGDLGNQFWDACYFMTKWVEKKCTLDKNYMKNKRVIELGSGLGLLGMCAALFGASVILTDYGNVVLENLRNNLKTNGQKSIVQSNTATTSMIQNKTFVSELGWNIESQMKETQDFDWQSIGFEKEKQEHSQTENNIDFIIGSDIIAGLYDLTALLSTFIWFSEKNPNLRILVAYRQRPFPGEIKFFHFAKQHFEINEMDIEIVDAHDRIGSDLKVLEFRKKN